MGQFYLTLTYEGEQLVPVFQMEKRRLSRVEQWVLVSIASENVICKAQLSSVTEPQTHSLRSLGMGGQLVLDKEGLDECGFAEGLLVHKSPSRCSAEVLTEEIWNTLHEMSHGWPPQSTTSANQRNVLMI
jgi:hypothetical protein